MSLNFSITLLVGGCLLVSCQNDPKTAQAQKPVFKQNDLIGRWELLRGFRNGKEIETLVGTYYEFSEDTMKTNLSPSMDDTFVYSYSENEITQKGDHPAVYTVDTLTPDFMQLSVNIENHLFKLELKKALPDSMDTMEDSIRL